MDAEKTTKILAEIAEFQRTHRAFEDFQRMAKLLFQGRMSDILFGIFNKQLDDYRCEL